MSFFKKIFSSEKKESVLIEQEKQTLDKGLEKSKTSSKFSQKIKTVPWQFCTLLIQKPTEIFKKFIKGKI